MTGSVKAVVVRLGLVRCNMFWCVLAVIVWRGLVRRDQSGYGGCGAVSGSWHD